MTDQVIAGVGDVARDRGYSVLIHAGRPGPPDSGLLKPVLTRMYFPDEDNGADPVLAAVAPERRATLVAVPEGDGLRFDVHLQGERETVFFAV